MSRPIKHFCYQLGRDLHMDVDIISAWSLSKLYEYMAFYVTETEKFKEQYKEDNMTPEERHEQLMKVMGV